MDVFAQPQGPLKFFGAKDISVDLCIEPERSYVFKFVSYTNIKKTCLTNNWDDKLDVLFWETHQVYETEWIQRMIIPHDMGFPTFSFFVCHDRGLRRMFIHVYKDSLVANRKKNCILFWKKKNVLWKYSQVYIYIYHIYSYMIYIYMYIVFICIFFVYIPSWSRFNFTSFRTSTTPLACIPCMAPGEFFSNTKGPNTAPVSPS